MTDDIVERLRTHGPHSSLGSMRHMRAYRSPEASSSYPGWVMMIYLVITLMVVQLAAAIAVMSIKTSPKIDMNYKMAMVWALSATYSAMGLVCAAKAFLL